MIINRIYDATLGYGKRVHKNIRKKIGQFFTPPSIANYMASLMVYNRTSIKILDAGAGTGILAGALCQVISDNNNIGQVHIDLYENNEDVLPILRENMEFVREVLEQRGKQFTYSIIQENFILSNADFWNDIEKREEAELYDVIISNPPYKKIAKSDEESVAMDSVVYGQPNIYFLFMAMSAKLLKNDGQLIFITPRSFVSGAYFKRFRKWFLSNVRLTNLHLFNSRGDVFDGDEILQEAIILKAIKTQDKVDAIMVSSSENMHFEEITGHEVPYETIVDTDSENMFIMIPTTEEEIHLLNTMKDWSYNLPSLGFKLKTGPVVDFRATELLREEAGENTVPLLWANHFSNYRISFPDTEPKNPQYIINTEESKSLLLESKDYILVKRFTSKEERRRVQCALYFSENFTSDLVGIENHLNYVSKLDGEITKEEMYGLFALLNSTFIDNYYRILNGSTQVNATEVNAIPLPSLQDVKRIGKQLMNMDSLSTEVCDAIIESLFEIDNYQAAAAV
ncbi:Eco57I restriction-modification methylase domain-containing protein [Brevibacillus agri]|uniref:Eco57I restriction-modification methylase domain-containing protein n=1 Tax=Brevibacillus TaxID=55080 RepID=UPI001562DF1A|nr:MULTISPECIES: Eco57I restriction-modification methylase domain-containing protein [Brevibacillus]MBE5393806.1 Eco57I restriction-modification methylase domain-containing protein [Brevibacillus borstelensis]MED1646001.1 Eco57I restriction-modification methylase domain-containing protein [Brevibacillus agri]MED1656314.1 Eco57I restriction-modification methylase domain-containing protein [Brevibacillus agri]MED1689236.1 Eco57I restriction-modification methylase domain-containing protein [Brevib